ncbi:MAG: RDD family protein [Verrucomicrobiota bacterium]|jgi:uncharacterized RDD family membrane protein YckC
MKNPFHLQAASAAGILFWLAAGGSAALAQGPATNAGAPGAQATPIVASNPPVEPAARPWSPFDVSLGSGQDRPLIFSDYVLHRGETNKGDVVVIRGDTTIDGVLEGDSVTILGNASIRGKTAGDVVVVLGSLKLGPQADIGGDVVVVGGKLDRAPGAKIEHGDVVLLFSNIPGFNGLIEWVQEGLFKGRLLPPNMGWVWMVAGVCLGVNLLLLLLFPRPIQACVNTMEGKALTSFATGVLVKLLAGLLTVLLLITMVGILLLPFLAIANLVAILFGKITTYRYVGHQLGRLCRLGFLQNPAAALILGTGVFYLLYTVPFLGFLAWEFSGVFGLGAVALTVFEQIRAGRAKPPVPTFPGTVVPATAENAPAAFSGLPPQAPVAEPAATPPHNAPAPLEKAPLPRAGFWIRFFALALDAALFCIVFGVLAHSRRLEHDWFGLDREDFCMILWLLYHVFLWTWKGTTIGGIIVGIKVIRLDGRPLDFPVALIRALASVLSFFVLGLGFFWVGITKEKQSWHDKIAGTVMVKVPPGMGLA